MNIAQQYQYVFDEKKLFIGVCLLVIVGIITITLFLSYTRFTGPRFYNDRYGRGTQDKHRNGLILSVFLLLVGIFFVYSYWHFMQIQRYCGIATGKLTQKNRNKKNNGWSYQYSFIAHSQLYSCAQVYAGNTVAFTDSCYTVLYDTTNPDNAIMLLNEPQHCK